MYIQEQGLLVREGTRLSVDALLFDMDGVLIDVQHSFLEAVCATVQFYFTKCLNFQGTTPLVRLEEVREFKTAQGFNSDWPITQSLILFFLEQSVQLGTRDLDVLIKEGRSITSLVEALRSLNLGFQGMEKILSKDRRVQECIRAYYDPEEIIRLYCEMYAGDLTPSIYNFTPRYVKGEGLVHREKVLLDPSLVTKPFGIITGRLEKEATRGLLAIPLSCPSAHLVTVDGGLEKPNPQTIVELHKAMGFQSAVFIGDTVDDYKTVENYRKESEVPLFFCGVESGALGSQAQDIFRGLCADVISPDVNTFLRYIASLS